MKISIVILNWNGCDMLRTFLPSVVSYSKAPEVEVCVADNGSSDQSLDMLRAEFPSVRLIVLDSNHGFADGYNLALKEVDAEYVVLLNSDVEVTPNWLEPLTAYMDAHPEVAACQPKLRSQRQKELFEYAGAAGGFIDHYGYPFCRGRIMGVVEEISLRQNAEEEKKKLLTDMENQLQEAEKTLHASAAELEQFNHQLENRIKQKERERNQKIQEEDTSIRNKQEEIHRIIATEKDRMEALLVTMDKDLLHELSGKGVDTERIASLRNDIARTEKELEFIEQHRRLVYDYEKDKREFFDRMDEFKNNKHTTEKLLEEEKEKFRLKEEGLNQKIATINKALSESNSLLKQLDEDIRETDNFKTLNICPPILSTGIEAETSKRCKKLVEELTRNHYQQIEQEKDFREAVNRFTGNFSEHNAFNFRTRLTKREEFMTFAADLKEFIDNDKIADYEKRSNEAYTSLIHRIAKETSDMLSKEGLIRQTIQDINNDFVERNFAGVIKSIALQTVPSGNRIMQHFVTIKEFNDENQLGLGMFSLFGQENQVERNRQAVHLLQSLVKELAVCKEKELTLSDTFELQFRIVENDNDSGWVEKLANVGSDGTDILVKAMINIMLLNVFKEKASNKFNDFKLHCMMDEIGKLHPNNIKGILDFANSRNIILVNSSPTSYRASDYRYTYILNKDKKNVTTVTRLIKQEAKD